MGALRMSALILALFFASLQAAQAKKAYAYVVVYETNGTSNNVSVINTSNNKVVKTIPVAGAFVSIDPRASFAYVAAGDVVVVISTSSKSVVAQIPVAEGAAYIAFAPNGKTAYATAYYSDFVSVINTKTRKVTATIEVQSEPIGMAVTPDGKFVYVVNSASGTVSVISTTINQIVNTIELGDLQGGQAYGIAISPDGSTAFVTFFNVHDQQGGVQVIDTASNTVVNMIDVPYEPISAAVSPDGRWLYVAQVGESVAVIDTSTQTLTNMIVLNNTEPVGVAFTADGSLAYVATDEGSWLPVIDTITQTSTTWIEVGNSPLSVAVTGTR